MKAKIDYKKLAPAVFNLLTIVVYNESSLKSLLLHKWE